MDAFGYIRVSKDQQANDGISLPAQTDLINQYAALYKHKIVEVFSDTDTCRHTNRPGFQEMIRHLMFGRAKMVIVYRLDLLFGNTLEAIKYAKEFQRWGVQLVSISERIDTSTPMGECLYTVITAIGQLRVREIGERTKMSLAYLRQQGLKYSGVPYGFRQVPTGEMRRDKPLFRLEKSPAEQAVIAQMIQLRKDGWGYRRIAQLLNTAGTPTKKGKSATHASVWHPCTVRDILMRTACDNSSNVGHPNARSSPDPQTSPDAT